MASAIRWRAKAFKTFHLKADAAVWARHIEARCFGDGDENTAKDMNQFIGSVEMLRNAFRPCTVLVVHHTGQKETSRGRGSALPGAVDTDINLLADQSVITLTCRKQKDAEEFKKLKLRRKVVSLEDGATSCAIELHTASGNANTSQSPPEAANDNELKALETLEEAGDEGLRHDDCLVPAFDGLDRV